MKKPRVVLFTILLIAALIRFYQLGQVPQGLFGDEVDAGYNAYSLIHTLRDYNGNFLPIHTESMGDNRAALFIWSLTPTIAILGLSEFSVRLAPALWGLLSIYLIYLVTKLGITQFKSSTPLPAQSLALFASGIFAIAPWHIHLSRTAFEVTFMLSLILIGIWCTLKSFASPKYLYAASIIFALYAYSYHVAKLFSPLLVTTLLIVYYPQFKKMSLKVILASAALYLLILLPLAADTLGGTGNSRFSSINILNTPTLEHDIIYARSQSSPHSLASRIIHNKATYLLRIFSQQYLTAFSPEFLFISGQSDNPRHSVPGFGLYPLWMIALYPLGIYFSFKHLRHPFFKLLIIWIIISPIASSLTINGARHLTRLSIILIPLTILLASGLTVLYGYVDSMSRFYRQLAIGFLLLISLTALINYTFHYYVNYSQSYYRWWNYGFAPAIQYATQNSSKYDRIAITRNHSSLPFLYYVFYTQYPPHLIHAQWQAHRLGQSPSPDIAIGKYDFSTLNSDDAMSTSKTLFIATDKDHTQNWMKVGEVPSPDPQETSPVFVFMQSRDMPPLLPQ